MTNPYYTATGAPAPNTQGRSAPIRDEFALIEVAFDDIDAQVDENLLRAIRLPVGENGEITDADADRENRVLTFDASGNVDVWPPQNAALRANRVLGWDENGDRVLAAAGSGYSWLPSQSGNADKYLTTDGTSPEWRALPMVGGLSSPSGSVTLTDGRVVLIGSYTLGDSITLPDARTITKGAQVLVESPVGGGTANGYSVRTNDGALLYTGAPANSARLLVLTDNSTQAGTWRVYTIDRLTYSGSNAVASGPETEVIASMSTGALCEISAGVYLLACGAASGGIRLAVVTAGSGLGVFSFSAGSTATAGTDACLTRSIAIRKLSTGYVVTYLTSATGDLKAVPVSVSGTTVTAGAIATIKAGVASGSYDLSFQTSGDKATVMYHATSTTVEIACLSYASNAITVGAAVVVHTAAAAMTTLKVQSVLSGADQGFAMVMSRDGTNYATNAYAFTISTTTITLGAGADYLPAATPTTTSHAAGIVAIDANTAVIAHAANSSATGLYVVRLTKSGTTVTIGTVTSGAAMTSFATVNWVHVEYVCGVILIYIEAAAGTCDVRAFYLNGTTPTVCAGSPVAANVFATHMPVARSATEFVFLHSSSTAVVAVTVWAVSGGGATITSESAGSVNETGVGVAEVPYPHSRGMFEINDSRFVHFEAPASVTIVETNA